MRGRALIGAALLIMLAGCKPDAGSSPRAPSQQQQGAGIIDTMTQKSKVDAGKRAAAKVREIGSEQQKDLDEVMGE